MEMPMPRGADQLILASSRTHDLRQDKEILIYLTHTSSGVQSLDSRSEEKWLELVRAMQSPQLQTNEEEEQELHVLINQMRVCQGTLNVESRELSGVSMGKDRRMIHR
jgi:hypothetical protein